MCVFVFVLCAYTHGNVCVMPTVFVVCGPSGVGKSTIGAALAAALGVSFVDGDTYHSVDNVSKMRAGISLTDADREPWLRQLRTDVVEESFRRGVSVVLACSALKKIYRDTLRGVRSGGDTCANEMQQTVHAARDVVTDRHHHARASAPNGDVFFVMLCGDAEVIAQRMQRRIHHFMPPSLLASQLAAQEPLDRNAGEVGVVIDSSATTEEILALVCQKVSCYRA